MSESYECNLERGVVSSWFAYVLLEIEIDRGTEGTWSNEVMVTIDQQMSNHRKKTKNHIRPP